MPVEHINCRQLYHETKMAQSLIPPPSKMEVKGDIVSNWSFFKDSWHNYVIATELNEKDKKIQVATLLSVMGKECIQIYKNLPLTDAQRKDPETIIKALGDHFEPQRNTIYERYLFNLTQQEPNETFDQFISRLRQLVATCEYGVLSDEMVRDRIVIGIRDNNARERLLRDIKLTLAKAIEACRTSERAAKQRLTMENSESVHYHRGKGPRHKHQKDQMSPRKCKYCGDVHMPGNCKAYGQICSRCNKRNHFAKVCKSKQNPATSQKQKEKSSRPKGKSQHVRLVEEDISDEQSSDESIFRIESSPEKTQYFAELHVKTEDNSTGQLKVQLDTGATCSTIKMEDYRAITDSPVQPSNTKLKLYDNTIVKPVGHVKLRCTANGITRKIHFEVVDRAPTSLLSGRACEALKLLRFNEKSILSVQKVPICEGQEKLTEEFVQKKYNDVFEGLGKLPGHYHIDINPNVKPVQNNPRRVPIPVKTELKQKLDEYERLDAIAKVTEPTAWISNMVAVRKPNKLRVCLDPFNLNKAINRNHYPTPTIEDVAPRLTKARIFSVVDAKDGFLQIVLDKESSYLTTFWTPFGRYRWLRMPFGLKSAPEEFQRRLDECLEGLENIEIIADDIIIYGSGDNDDDAEYSHDIAFKALLDRCRQRGLKLNKKKLRFKLKAVTYMGHKLGIDGISPDPEKVKAITEMPRPTDVQSVQRLIGVVTYLSKFMPQLSTVCEPLRRLTDKEAVFDWLPQHETAFKAIQDMITQAPVLHYYDVNDDVTIECDSSEVGMGAVITQKGHPVAYASRALTQTERNYAQIEKECLAIVFATEKFQQYIIGKNDVTVITDHKPLVNIFKKSILTSPKRLQRMRLRLQKFSINVIYKPGPQMYISDTLSRAALPLCQPQKDDPRYIIFQLQQEQLSREEIEAVNMEDSLFISDQRLQEVRQNTAADSTLQVLMNIISKGWPENKTSLPLCVREYWPYREELTTQNGLVFRGTRIIIPTSMRPQMIDRAHASHGGIQYTVNTARDIMYWPRMNTDLTEAVQKCSTCQESQPAQTAEPMMSHPIPTLPWQSLASDCFEYKHDQYLVVVDMYSDFIELARLQDLSTESIINAMKPMFATHGTPARLVTDNATCYVSREFQQFIRAWDIEHVTSSPHHPKSNGKAESAVKIAKNIVKKCYKDKTDLWKALLEWRNTVTPGMKTSPSQRLMSRRTRSFLPCANKQYQPKVPNDIPENIIHKRQLAKYYHDRHVKALPQLVVGQPVRVKVHPQQAKSAWKSGTIIDQISPRSYTARVDGRDYTRNRLHLRDSREIIPFEITVPETIMPDLSIPNTSDMNQNSNVTPRDKLSTDKDIGKQAETPSKSVTNNKDSVPVNQTKDTVVSRSGRAHKVPKKFQDFVMQIETDM